MGCCESQLTVLKNNLLQYYKKTVELKLKAYVWDIGMKDGFALRICKENQVSLPVAKKWMEFYSYFMVYVGWLHNQDTKVKWALKPLVDPDTYLILPYELIQVWRTHVLFSDKYFEFCQIVGGKITESLRIEFKPPKSLWMTKPMTDLNKYFKINKKMILAFCDSQKDDLESIFEFQSTYLKNTISFCLEEGGVSVNNVVKIYEGELQNPTGIFSQQITSMDDIRRNSEKIINVINSGLSTTIEDMRADPPVGLDCELSPIIQEKLRVFKNLNFGPSFLEKFSKDHLLNYSRAISFIEEYKKFLFLISLSRIPNCPSEEVDLVWHYHQTHIKDYLEFCQQVMRVPILPHNPSGGTVEDDVHYRKVYNETIESIKKYYGTYDPSVWPEENIRFSQVFKWFNHFSILQRCSNWAKNVEPVVSALPGQKVSANRIAIHERNQVNVYHAGYGCAAGWAVVGVYPVGCGIGCGHGCSYGCGIGCGVGVGCGGGGCGGGGDGGAASGCGSSGCGSGCGGGCGGGGCG